MPTTIATPSNANTKIRFNEQYVSAGLNQKTVGPIPNGIIRGGVLQTTGAGLNVQINLDPSTGDSVYTYTTPTGFQLTHRETGIRVLNLATLAGQTVYIALYALYAIGVPTVVEWRAYTEAELFGGVPVAEANNVIILGQVVVPGVGPIPAANVASKRARRAWKDVSAGMLPWKQIVQNGSFESNGASSVSPGNLQGIVGYKGEEVGSAAISVVAGASQHGLNYLNVVITAGADIGRLGPGNFALANAFSSGVVPVTAGQLIDASCYIEGVTVPAYAAGTSGVRLIFQFYSAAGALLATEQVASDPAVHVGSFSWTRLDRIFAAPSTGIVRWYLECGNNAGACVWHVDDISILIEPRGGDRNNDQDIIKPTIAANAVDIVPFNNTSLLLTMERIVRLTAQNAGGTLTGLKFAKNESITAIRWLSSFIFDGNFSQDETTYGLLGSNRSASTFSLVHKYAIAADGQYIRMYISGSGGGGYVVTSNASWDGAQWVRDASGRPAIKVMLGNDNPITADPTFFRIQHKNTPAPANWLDSAWDRTVSLFANADGDIEYTTKVRRERFLNLQEVMNFNHTILLGQVVWTLSASSSTHYIGNSSVLAQLWIPIPGFIPDGSDLIDVQVGFESTGPGNADPVLIQFIRTQPDEVTTPLVINAGQSTVVAQRSTGPQAQPYSVHLKLSDGGSLPHTLDLETYNYQCYFAHGQPGGSVATVSYIKMVWDDPGPGGR